MLNRKAAAILCGHVARHENPMLLAVRTEPEEEQDSGWQFLCNAADDEDWREAQTWDISEVLELEPSLAPYIDLLAGTVLVRAIRFSEWRDAPDFG